MKLPDLDHKEFIPLPGSAAAASAAVLVMDQRAAGNVPVDEGLVEVNARLQALASGTQ